MSSEPGREDGIDATDLLALLVAGAVAVGLGIINPGDIRDNAVTWMLEHQVLASAQDAWIPIGDRAGLGWRHLAILTCVAVAAIGAHRLHRRHKQPAPKP